jgi:Ca2+:H+ antiporter
VTLVNMMPFVVIVVGLGWGSSHEFQKEYAAVLFPLSLLSTVPLSYYIGTAISRLTAQSSFAIGAILCATFGSIVEIILYVSALFKGHYDMTLGSLTGTFLGQLVLVPGLAFVAGGIKHKEQLFNREAAGVSSIMVILAVVGVYLPTMLYEMNRVEEFRCRDCFPTSAFNISAGGSAYTGAFNCPVCQAHEGSRDETLIREVIVPIANGMAVILPITYIVGLIFTLKTHAHLYLEDEDEEDKTKNRHISEWSRLQCIVILGGSTVMFALVAEVMTNVLQGALDAIGITEAYAGLFIISLVANITEIVNAVRFAMDDNVSLALEIGSSAAIQCAFIQVPILILVTRIGIPDFHFLFDNFSAVAIIFATLFFNYVSIDGRSNYFEGCALLTLYSLLAVAFYYLQRIIPTHKP